VWPLRASRILRQAVYSGVVALATASVQAETWRIEPWVGVEETLTNNVNLDSNATRRSDFVTQLTPGFRVIEKGAHTTLAGTVSLPILLYARTGSENNSVVPQVNLFGNWEIVDHFFFVDGSASVSQEYLTPFGARSDSLANANNNRFTGQVYRLSPYIKGDTSDYTYTLRDDNTWTKGDASAVNSTYTNDLAGTFQRDPRPFGWAVDVDRTTTKFQDQSKQQLELARARGLYQVDPQVLLSVSGGYEHNDLLLETKGNIIYGAGFRWRPSERTNVEGTWEHRFFGASYNFVFENRSPLSVWSVAASRNITTYPQQLASLSAGTDVATTLNQLFLSRVTDPAARQALVNQLILDRGLPAVLSSGVNIYSEQITLRESLLATAGILGARNSVFFSLYRLHEEPITSSGNIPPEFLGFQNNTQHGANVVWSHTLTPLMTLTGSVDGSRTVDNTQTGTSRQASVRVGLTSPVSAVTDVYGGIRYQIFRSDISSDYSELAVFVGLNHRFH